jgi:hypothetical protein
MGGVLSILGGGNLFEASGAVTGQPWYIPDFFYNLENQAAPDQVYAANLAANADIVRAEINPITGKIVPAAQAYADKTAGAAGAAEQQTFKQSTGSPIADTFNSVFSSFTGAAGDAAALAPSSFPWGTLLLVAAVGVGGYLILKKM